MAEKAFIMTFEEKTIPTDTLELEWLEIQAAQVDPYKFQPLYDRYFDQIFRFVIKRTGNPSLSQEICSDIFFKALQKLGKYQYKGVPFSAWLYRIASNEIAQTYRDQKKTRHVSVAENQLADIAEEILPEASEIKTSENLVAALQELDSDQLLLIEMRFFELRPFKEIAQILDITESNAKVKTYRILEKMKKIILNSKKSS